MCQTTSLFTPSSPLSQHLSLLAEIDEGRVPGRQANPYAPSHFGTSLRVTVGRVLMFLFPVHEAEAL